MDQVRLLLLVVDQVRPDHQDQALSYRLVVNQDCLLVVDQVRLLLLVVNRVRLLLMRRQQQFYVAS
ncbi:MAG: hypothetical protein VKJ64_03850 [Leptolyngbyaceae bacterium]|nr:hypothetical protein [Leptolyngbyaceae bacterium]